MVFMEIVSILMLYFVWDCNYILRCLYTFGFLKIFSKKARLLDTISISGICTPHDSDISLKYMNNARYLREFGFARYYFYEVTPLRGEVRSHGGGFVQATNIRYRRPIPMFTRYRIETRVIWWDEQSIYLEQKVITISDNYVRAVALSKQYISSRNLVEVLKKMPGGQQRPLISDELKLWLISMEISYNKRTDNNISIIN